MLCYFDTQILWFPSHIADFTINSSPEQVYVAVYGIIVILDLQNIWHHLFCVILFGSRDMTQNT